MNLYETITSDMKTAMKSGDKQRLEVIRFMLSQLNSFQKEKMAKEAGAGITDDEVISILQKDAKRRKDSIELFKQGGRQDLVSKEEADIAVIAGYLPQEMPREEIVKVVSDLKTQGFTEFTVLMREAMKTLKGRADGKVISEVVKELTS